jgi:LysR family cys regulon transcriptional activator
MGIGIIASMALDPAIDQDLVALDASHLFASSVTHIGFRRGTFMRRFMYDFVKLFAPHLTSEQVDAAVACSTRAEREKLFANIDLPTR